MQLTVQQRTFLVTNYLSTGSFHHGQELFEHKFPGRGSPSKSTIWRNVLKYQQHGTSYNLNQGKAARTEENIGMVRDLLKDNQLTVSTRRNEFSLTNSSFNRIILRDLKWYPYKMPVN